ncbi:serine/threonine-protein kinase [Amycolatopsis sp. NPDC059657]|uniref:serine/threonine-protein kinase n=1 Tax=Amycolatopsis sp. NPDC059657 TaxID=3346899 RepID=UPI00366AFAF9
MSDEGRLVADRYRIVRRIGTGAMGAVWQAHDEVLARTVAVKQLFLQPGLEQHDADDARQRTMREGRIAARLHHPNAITVFDVVTDDRGQPCLIMEYLPSTSLAQVLQEQGTLEPTEVARIGAQIAAALKEAHAVGIVHRDIKPGNILLGGNGIVKITDFGISRATDDVTVTKTGMIAGTPAYLAPEVAIGGEPGSEADVFSLGSTLYAACEGQPPFGLSENTLSLLHKVAAGQIDPPRQSGPLASVLAVLLHPDVHHRPTAEECEELLAAVARGETPLGGPTDATHLAPVAGVLGGPAPGSTQLFEGEDGHSGTLLDQQEPPRQGGFYDDQYDYDDGGGAYPQNDYDNAAYDSGFDRTTAMPPAGPPPGPNATRAVPMADYDDYEDDFDDEPPAPAPPPPRRPAAEPAAKDDEEKPGAWKKPAIIGGIVLVGLIAMGIWVFSPRSSTATTDTKPSTSAPSTTKSSPTTTESTPTEESTTPTETTTKKTTSSKTTTSETPTKTTPPTTTKTTPTSKTTTSSPTKSSSTETSSSTPAGG